MYMTCQRETLSGIPPVNTLNVRQPLLFNASLLLVYTACKCTWLLQCHSVPHWFDRLHNKRHDTGTNPTQIMLLVERKQKVKASQCAFTKVDK